MIVLIIAIQISKNKKIFIENSLPILGSTSPNDWEEYKSDDNSIYVNIDISRYEFDEPPHIFTTLRGEIHHWKALGVNSLYDVTNQNFTIYLTSLEHLNHTLAQKNGWYIDYILFKKQNSNHISNKIDL